MAELIAQGTQAKNRWRRPLPDQPITLGRLASHSDWDVPWDNHISKVHATLHWQDGQLTVRRQPRTTNFIFFKGKAENEFTLPPGEKFVIGNTTFLLYETVAASGVDRSPPSFELVCSREELESVKFTNADQRIEVLAALPGMIRFSPTDEELESRVLEVLLRGIPHARTAAVVWRDPAASAANMSVEVRCATSRAAVHAPIQPSRRLLQEALCRRRQSVLHCWGGGTDSDLDYRTVGEGNWALCAPLPDEPYPGWALYVTGGVLPQPAMEGTPRQEAYKSDLKFAELVADIFGALRQVHDLQGRQAVLARFFSRPVLAAIAGRDINEVLRPRACAVTVLFCDLRGSCRIAEEGEQDLAETCKRLGAALNIMTAHIIDKDGVIGDFQGDAAMGFWGWPLESADQIEQAARAALAIRREFARVAQQPEDPLYGFACGIGLAHGTAIAGRLGTADQFKVSVFGPVVNLAARLESMTKHFQVAILADDQVHQGLQSGRLSHWVRCRSLAQIQPYGMRRSLLVTELLPAAVEPGAMKEADRRDYEAALEAFTTGKWPRAADLLRRLPNDGPRTVLQEFMDKHGGQPPEGWNGVIPMDKK